MDSNPTSSSHPLRPYYVAPATDSDWAFGSRPIASSSTRNSSYPDSLRISSTNRYESSTSFDDLESPAAGAMLQSFLMSSILSFTSTALVMPFEVGKTLAQVQWVPKDGIEPTVWLGTEGIIEDEAIEVRDFSF